MSKKRRREEELDEGVKNPRPQYLERKTESDQKSARTYYHEHKNQLLITKTNGESLEATYADQEFGWIFSNSGGIFSDGFHPCVALMLYDPTTKVIGLAHTGRTMESASLVPAIREGIQAMKEMGSVESNIEFRIALNYKNFKRPTTEILKIGQGELPEESDEEDDDEDNPSLNAAIRSLKITFDKLRENNEINIIEDVIDMIHEAIFVDCRNRIDIFEHGVPTIKIIKHAEKKEDLKSSGLVLSSDQQSAPPPQIAPGSEASPLKTSRKQHEQ